MSSIQATYKPPARVPGFPLVGSLPQIARDPIEFVMRLQRDYGDVVSFLLGREKAALISDPKAIDEVLLETGKRYGKFKPTYALRTVLGNGLVTSDGDFWKRQRKLAAPSFHHQSIKNYADVMVSYAQDMLATWQNGVVRDVHQEMMLLTQRIIMKALFDVDMMDNAKDTGKAFDAMMHGIGAEMNGLDAFLPTFIQTRSRTQMADGVAYIDGLLLDFIEKRRTENTTRYDLLTMLMEARDDDGQQMSTQQMLDEIRTLYLAGHETTAATLSWAWLLLSQNPAVYAKLEAEIDGVLNGNAPTADDVQNLPYTNAIIKEALRCYPVAWVFQRTALEDVTIGGYQITKDTRLWISPWVLHHDPRWYAEPDSFVPERWLKDKSEQPPREAYIPFGGGPRVCIGNGLAMMEAVLLLATIAQRYQVSVLPTHPVKIEVTGTIRPKYGLKATLTERTP